MYLEITTDTERLDEETESNSECDTNLVNAQSHITCSPAEAEGELVYFERPGTVGKDVYRITAVDAESKETTLENLSTGGEIVIDDEMPFPPDWNRFSIPNPGTRITVYWKEHLNGAGDWVRTTPKRTRNRVERYYGRYTGHEKTRCIEQTMVYTPPGVTEHEIKSSTGDGVEIYFTPDDGDITGLDRVFDQVASEPSTYTTVGYVYLNENNDIVWFEINPEYTEARIESPYTVIEAINEDKKQQPQEQNDKHNNEFSEAIRELKQADEVNNAEKDEIDKELDALSNKMSNAQKDEIDKELNELSDELSDEQQAEIDNELETRIHDDTDSPE